jgi:hypothetical protein
MKIGKQNVFTRHTPAVLLDGARRQNTQGSIVTVELIGSA